MKFPVFSLLAGNLAFSETSSQLTPPSSGESVIQRQLDSGCAGDVTLVPRERDGERQVERVMTSYEGGSFLIDRLAAGMVVDQDCAKSCQTVLPIPCADGHTPGATALGLLSSSHSPAHFAAVSFI